MNNVSRQLLTLIIFLTLGVVASISFGDEYRKIDQLASKIQRRSRQLNRESHRFRNTPLSLQLADDLNTLQQLVERLQQVNQDSLATHYLAHDLEAIDFQTSSIQGLVHEIERSASLGRGHFHGNTKNMHRLLISVHASVQEMLEEIERLVRRHHLRRLQSEDRDYDHYGRPVKQPNTMGYSAFSLNPNGFVIPNLPFRFSFGF